MAGMTQIDARVGGHRNHGGQQHRQQDGRHRERRPHQAPERRRMRARPASWRYEPFKRRAPDREAALKDVERHGMVRT